MSKDIETVNATGLSDKFFKEYISYMKNIADQSAKKCKEIIDNMPIQDIDEYGNPTKEKKKTEDKKD